jgi:hypothetical protein
MKPQSEAEKLKSILVIVTGFLVLGFIFKKPAFYYTALIIGLLSLIIPAAQTVILYIWNKIAQVLGWINTRILLTLVFYLFLFPVSLLSKLFTKNMLGLKRPGGSVYTERNHTYTASDLENPW